MSEQKTPFVGKSIEYNPFEGPEVAASILATDSQLEIWLSCKLGGDDANRAYNESLSLEFDGELNQSDFEKALSTLVHRHESLRSAFSLDGSRMVIFKDVSLNYIFEDLTGLSKTEKVNKIHQFKRDDVLHIFDLLNGPLYKFSLLKLAPKEYYFTITAHHIICDGWSIGLLIQDLSKLYSAFVQNIPPVLPEPDLFSEYANEQIKFSNSNEYIKNETFWLDQFKKNVPILNLPTDFPRPIPRTYKSSRLDFHINEELFLSLKTIGIKDGCSFVNTLLAAFELFLHSVTGQEDIIIGLPAAGQLVSGKYELVGHCVNLLPIRSYPNPHLNFSEYLKVRKLAILDSYEHQKLTFGSLLKKIKAPRNASRIPLVPVVFNIDMEIEKNTHFHGLSFDIHSNPREYENFELYLNVWSSKRSIQLEWSYNTLLFQKETVERMMSAFEDMLRAIVSDPLQKIEKIINIYPVNSGKSSKEENREILTTQKSFNLLRTYWSKQFQGDLPVLELPIDRVRPAIRSFISEEVNKTIDKDLIKKLQSLLRSQNGSMFDGLLALVNVLLYKYTNQEDIIIGGRFLVPGNGLPEEKNYTLALRSKFKGEDNFTGLLEKINRVNSDANNHLLPFDTIVKELHLDVDNSRHTLFDVMVVLQNEKGKNDNDPASPDLKFTFTEAGEELLLNLRYNCYIFDEATITRMIKHLEGILKSIVEDPSAKINRLEYLSVREQTQLLNEFNLTETPYPNTSTIVELFEEQVSKSPDNIALIYEDVELTYHELNERSNAFGDYLRKNYHIRADDLIGVRLEKTEWSIIALLGILKSGGAYVPIDDDYPKERIDFILKDTKCKVVIDQDLLIKFTSEENNYNKTSLPLINGPSDLAYVMYTSGSTGQPKGVMVEQKNVIRLVKSATFIDLKGKEVLLSTGAFAFDATTFEYWSMLLNGGKLVICSQKVLLDIKLLAEYMEKHAVEIMWFTSGWLNQLVDADIAIFKGLKCILAGGEKLSPSHINKLRLQYPELKIINGYGPTENTTFSLTFHVNKELRNIPIGRPISNSSAYILNAFGQILPVGIAGEIYLGGEGVSRGYLNDHNLTSEKFLTNPFRPGERIYKSGDIGRWLPDGNIEYLGRKDQQVKIRGYRIELGEIENVLQQHPSIESAIILIHEGDSVPDKNMVAYVMSQEELDTAGLRNFLKERIPSYMIPGSFILLRQFPLTSNGKIDRKTLAKSNNSDAENIDSDIRFNTEKEKLIAAMWSDLLGIKYIKTTDNFFEIGGHSLIAIQFIIRLENELNVKLPMSALFEYPTIEKISKLLQSEDSAPKWKSLVVIKPSGTKNPLYLVHGGGLGVLIFNNIVMYLDKDQPVYGLQALGIDGKNKPLESIEDMAKFYITEILEQNPHGPYILAGLSAGGLIAFEMAQQLKTLGKEVKTVAIFDFNLIETEEVNSLNEKLKKIFFNFSPIILFNIISLFKYPKRTIKYYIMCWELRYFTMLKRFGYEKPEELTGVHLDLLKAVSKNDRAIKGYKLKPYDGVIDLFISKEKVYFQKDPKFMGWKPYALKGINIHEVNGDHDDMILQPNNKFFAETLQKILDQR